MWNDPSKKYNAILELRDIIQNPKKYKPNLVLRVYIPKSGTNKLRPLGLPTTFRQSYATFNSITSRSYSRRIEWLHTFLWIPKI
jgi:retron-type reverse transcriptase